MTEAAKTESAKTEPKTESVKPASGEGRMTWVLLAASLLAALAVLVGLHLWVGVGFDAPTLALALACAVLIWALRGMWGIVVALARPTVDTLIDETLATQRNATVAELREEKRRVLRAIKELEFDHSMGKLSDEDYAAIGARYKLRAIEVMRALDEGDELHPLLAEHLRMIEQAEAQP